MEPKVPLTGGGEDPDARPEFFTYPSVLGRVLADVLECVLGDRLSDCPILRGV